MFAASRAPERMVSCNARTFAILMVGFTADTFGLSVAVRARAGATPGCCKTRARCPHALMLAPVDEGACDYLVIGAGAIGMAFVDSMLLANPACKIVVVDKHEVPGGHWTVAYDHVRLHHASIVYGLESTNWRAPGGASHCRGACRHGITAQASLSFSITTPRPWNAGAEQVACDTFRAVPTTMRSCRRRSMCRESGCMAGRHW